MASRLLCSLETIMNKISKTLLTLGLLLTLQPLFAQETAKEDSQWIYIAKNSENTDTYSAKKGSFEITSTKSGTEIALILGQIENHKNNKFKYNKWYVATSDCERGMGKIVILKVNGDYDFESDFVADGNNIASGIADFICSVYKLYKKQKQGKGV